MAAGTKPLPTLEMLPPSVLSPTAPSVAATHGHPSMATPTHILPCLDFTEDPKTLDQGSLEWSNMCASLREVLEKYGCAIVKYDRVPGELVDKMFAVLPPLFALPVETKRKNESLIPYEKYVEPSPFYEALGVHDSEFVEEARAFTQLMWPHGNDDFCQSMNLLSRGLLELVQIVGRMVCDSYGAGRHYSKLENMRNLLRLSRYPARSPTNEKPPPYFGAHTDGSFLTVLCQNDIDALQFKTREGDWFPLHLGKGCFVIFVGQQLQAWSNGRMFAVPHQVSYNGDKDRLSCGLFTCPKGPFVMEAPEEFTDNGKLPLFKPFSSSEYVESILSNKHMELTEDVESILSNKHMEPTEDRTNDVLMGHLLESQVSSSVSTV